MSTDEEPSIMLVLLFMIDRTDPSYSVGAGSDGEAGERGNSA